MPSDSADFTGRMATVTGWGRLKYGGGVPSVLQEVQVGYFKLEISWFSLWFCYSGRTLLNSLFQSDLKLINDGELVAKTVKKL